MHVAHNRCDRSKAALLAAAAVVLLHAALLVRSIPDYMVTIDSAYHVAIARQYGEYGLVPWDHVNFAPRGRPNLQGPLLHLAIGYLGRAFAGRGRDYVLANAILAVAQWAAAAFSAAFFAFELGGDTAMLLAVSLFTGAGFTAASFAVGIPSGWLFILAPWAIWFFLKDRSLAAALVTAASIYVHIAGYVTAPVGLMVTAALTGRWRSLLRVGALTALFTIPYTMHCLRYAGWLSGLHSHSAVLLDPLLDGLALAAAIWLMLRPRANVLILAWLAAPLAWLFQDPSRFVLQSGLAGAVAAGLALTRLLDRTGSRWRRAVMTSALVFVATLCPLGIPSLLPEAAWVWGLRFPRAVNWKRAQVLANAVEHSGHAGDPVSDYAPALCPALAVYASVHCEKGHWIEVAPRFDPADKLSAKDKIYVLPLAGNDPVLAVMEKRRWVTTYGGTGDSAVAALETAPTLDEARNVLTPLIGTEAAWLSEHAVNNSFTLGDATALWTSTQTFLRRRRTRLSRQRFHAGRIELACLIYSAVLEGAASHPAAPTPIGAAAVYSTGQSPAAILAKQAAAMRAAAREFGVMASFLSDDFALDFVGSARQHRMTANLANLARIANGAAQSDNPTGLLIAPINRLFADYLGKRRAAASAERPSGAPWSWLEI